MDEPEQTTQDATATKAGNDPAAEPAVLQMTVQVIRAGTGKVETFELTGTPLKEER